MRLRDALAGLPGAVLDGSGEAESATETPELSPQNRTFHVGPAGRARVWRPCNPGGDLRGYRVSEAAE